MNWRVVEAIVRLPIRSLYELTDPRQFFAEPATPRQRQYEALRAYFVERLASAEAARRFGYSPGAFRVLCHTFRRGELPDFFTTAHPGPREQPKKSAAQKQIVALRKRNYSVYEISQGKRGKSRGSQAVAQRCLTIAGKYGTSGWFGTARREPR